ncbi:TldD/PmbA family protein [Candidatus Nitrosotenuis chungbukensis]|uniref:TldD/PmbA family protein n=1 Tax=Candidatus Nitrosotenuis chungbukensis TaxID=1353246 RepID=UPI0005B2C666|nr:TldD/PmbA family protein [Candidatus Nitrosotenuis chungbukensis]WKT57713.1 TldD/PmbA family protein [Candidatus Nitrosotenuis chungbukensis]
MLKEHAEKAIQFAQSNGCSYSDARVEIIERHGFIIENGQIEHSITRHESGIGIRVLCDGAWGFYSTSDVSKIKNGVIDAIKAARHNSQKKKNPVSLAKVPTAVRNVNYKIKKEATPEALEGIAFDCDKIIQGNKKIIKSIVSASSSKVSKYFVSSEGSKIMQEFSDTIMDLTAIAHQNGLTQSINTTEGGRGGVEKITDDADIFHIAKETSDNAVRLLDARHAREEKATVVMNPDFVALLTHEILGHPSEADRVLGKEMAWAGGAWWSGMLGEQIGSKNLNVIDDPTMEGNLGWYEYDDEGTKSQRKQLVKDGNLVDHMHSRETADIFNKTPNASMRATSYRFMPLIRMACTCIEKGNWDPQEMIKDVKNGYLVSNMKIPSIDMRRYNWSISCQYANKIENGEVTDLLRDVIVVGTAPEFFNSIDACGKDFTVRPITNCGKGDPMQQMMMGNGGPSIRGIATVKSTGT